MDFIEALTDPEFRDFINQTSTEIDDTIAEDLLATIDFKENP